MRYVQSEPPSYHLAVWIKLYSLHFTPFFMISQSQLLLSCVVVEQYN